VPLAAPIGRRTNPTRSVARSARAAIMRVQVLQLPCRPREDAGGEIDVGDGTWTEELKNRFAGRVVNLLGRYLPNLPGAILGRHVIAQGSNSRCLAATLQMLRS
jgi:hypothetical protein